MAHIKADRIQETSTGTGTGALTLAGAVSKYRAFSAALANTDVCVCLIENASAAEWEISLCTYASGGNTLTRSAVYASNTGSLINFSAGTKTISLVPTAVRMVVEDNAGTATVSGNISALNHVIGSMATSSAGTMGFTNGNGPSIVFWGTASAGIGLLEIQFSGSQVAQITSTGIRAVAAGHLGFVGRGYLSSSADGVFALTNNAGSAYGTLQVAGVQSGALPGTQWAFDATLGIQTIVNGATFSLSAGSGLVVLTEHTGGETGLYLCGGGTVVLASQTAAAYVAGAPGAGKIGLEYSGGVYRINNNSGGSRIIGIGGTRTRTSV